MAIAKYERISGAKINFEKSEGLRLGPWRGDVSLPESFRWSDEPVCNLRVWFGQSLQLSQIGQKYRLNGQVGTWLRRSLSLKGEVEVCTVYIFPWIFYRLSVLPLLEAHRLALQWFLTKLLWGGRRPIVYWQVICQHSSNRGLGIPDLENHWFAENLIYLGQSLSRDSVWGWNVSDAFSRLKSDPKAEGQRKLRGEAPFVRKCRKALHSLPGSSDLSRLRNELYQDLVVGSTSDPLVKRFGCSMEEVRCQVLASWTTPSSHSPGGFHETRCLFLGLNYKAGLADMPACLRCSSDLEETAEHGFYYSEWVRPFWNLIGEWTARIEHKQFMLLDVRYFEDNVSPYQVEKRVVFLAILAVARIVIWTTRKKWLYDDANFSHRDPILFFKHQLRVKIRCDRKHLDRITFDKRWVYAASLVVWKGATLEASFSPLPAHGDYGPDPSGPHLW